MTKFAIDDPRHPGVKDGGYTTFANKDDDPTLMFCKCDYGNVECHRLMHKHVRLCHANKTVLGVYKCTYRTLCANMVVSPI